MEDTDNLKIESYQQQFKEKGYAVIEGFVPPGVAALIANYARIRVANKDMDIMDDGFVDFALTNYGDYITESMLVQVIGLIEKVTDKELAPTYSYLRYYRDKDKLPVHVERYSCQYGVTLCCGYDYNKDVMWPIHIKGKDGKKKTVDQQPGDALVYLGCDLEHWRDQIPGGHHVQVHLHYIGKDEPYADELTLDTRYRLGQKSTTRKADIIKKYERIQASSKR